MVRIHLAVNPRFPGQGSSSQGKSGPKARPKGVVDGKRVNIPVPLDLSDGVTEKDRSSGRWMSRFKLVGGRGKKNPSSILREASYERRKPRKVIDSMLPRKASKR